MISNLTTEIEKVFEKHGFTKEIIRGKVNYVRNGEYMRIDYIESWQTFVIEYAASLEDAQKNLYEDGDLYPVSLGDSLISLFEEDMVKYML